MKFQFSLLCHSNSRLPILIHFWCVISIDEFCLIIYDRSSDIYESFSFVRFLSRRFSVVSDSTADWDLKIWNTSFTIFTCFTLFPVGSDVSLQSRTRWILFCRRAEFPIDTSEGTDRHACTYVRASEVIDWLDSDSLFYLFRAPTPYGVYRVRN